MKILVVIAIWIGLMPECTACKCNGPGSVRDSLNKKGIIIKARVIGIDTVAYSDTMVEKEAKEIERNLKDNPERLAFFTSKSLFKVRVLVMEKFKGEDIIDTVAIYTPTFGGSCGYGFQLNREYIIYGSGRGFYSTFFDRGDDDRKVAREHTYWTNHCTRTKLFDEAEAKELRALRG
jgi:hypothetical protein